MSTNFILLLSWFQKLDIENGPLKTVLLAKPMARNNIYNPLRITLIILRKVFAIVRLFDQIRYEQINFF